jgi:hypothetical protein
VWGHQRAEIYLEKKKKKNLFGLARKFLYLSSVDSIWIKEIMEWLKICTTPPL